MNLARFFVFASAFCFLHFMPRMLLDLWLKRKLDQGPLKFTAQFSGRVSLYCLAKQLRFLNSKHVVLLPNYVCNVVPRAFYKAKWEIGVYEINDEFEADIEEIMLKIEEFSPSIIVGATIFGSSGLINLLENKNFIELLKKKNIEVILDLAQDIRLVKKIPISCYPFVHVVISFNDKSFVGAMGGGILSSKNIAIKPSPATWSQSVALYFWFFRKIVKQLHAKKRSTELPTTHQDRCFDYSFCTTFPYSMEQIRPLKLQLILAILGIYSLRNLQKRKLQLISHRYHAPTRFAETATYLNIRDADNFFKTFPCRIKKRPYAIEGDPAISLREADVMAHNKGFWDKI